jgi:hypothetical protein
MKTQIKFDQDIHDILNSVEAVYYDAVAEFDRLLAETGLPLLTDWEYELLAAPPVIEAFPVTTRIRRGWRRVIGWLSAATQPADAPSEFRS